VLAASLFFVAIVMLALGVTLEGSLAFARVSARHAAEHYAELGLPAARTALVDAVASQIANHAPQLEAPPPLAPAAACGDGVSSCPFTIAASFSFAGFTGGDGPANVSATELQTHPAIAEGRLAATIAETVRSAAGVPLATRTEFVTLRTFSIPPYAQVDGITDAAGARDVPFEADAGGCDPTAPASCDSGNGASPSTPAPAGLMNPADTRIHALSKCVDGGNGACAGQIYAGADPPDIAAQTPWFNANAEGSKPYAISAAVANVGALLDDARSVAQTSGNGATLLISSSGTSFTASVYPFRPTSGADLGLAAVRTIRGTVHVTPAAIFIDSSGTTASDASWTPAAGALDSEPRCAADLQLTFSDGLTAQTHAVPCSRAQLQ